MDGSIGEDDNSEDKEPDSLAEITDNEKEDELMSKASLHGGQPSTHDRGSDEADCCACYRHNESCEGWF